MALSLPASSVALYVLFYAARPDIRDLFEYDSQLGKSLRICKNEG